MSVVKLFDYISMASTLIPLGALLYFHKSLDKALKILLSLLIVSFCCDVFNVLLSIQKKNNEPIFTTYSFLEGSILTVLYYSILNNRLTKKIVVSLFIVMVLSSIVGFIEIKTIYQPNTILTITELIILISFSLLFFYQLIKELPVSNIFDYHLFWINSGVLVMASLSIFTFLFERWIIGNKALTYLWLIFYFANIIFRLLLLKGIWKFLSQKI